MEVARTFTELDNVDKKSRVGSWDYNTYQNLRIIIQWKYLIENFRENTKMKICRGNVFLKRESDVGLAIRPNTMVSNI